MPTVKANLPILGIYWLEERENRADKEQVHLYGPCTDCGELDWLSQSPDDEESILCGPCWYGPQWEGHDPVVGDILNHLRVVFRQVSSVMLEEMEDDPTYHQITTSINEEVDHLICPHCREERKAVHLSVFGQWACATCTTEAATKLQSISQEVTQDV